MNGYLILFIIFAGLLYVLLDRLHHKKATWAFVAAPVCLLAALTCGARAVGLSYSLMICLLLLTVYFCRLGQSGKMLWARPVAVALGVLAMSIALVKIVRTASGIDAKKERSERNRMIAGARLEHERVRMTEIGKVMAALFAGSRALIIASPFTDKETWEIQLAALKSGFGTKVSVQTVVSWVAIAADNVAGAAPIDTSRLTAPQFNQYVKDSPGCNLIISFAGLPVDIEKLQIWQLDEKKRPKLALVDGSVKPYKILFDSNLLQLAVIQNPKVNVDVRNVEALTRPKQYFAEHYLTITPENANSIFTNYGLN